VSDGELRIRNVEISRSKISGTTTFLGARAKSKQLPTLTQINELEKITIIRYRYFYFVQKFEICLAHKMKFLI
jgi:hypothetical protein